MQAVVFVIDDDAAKNADDANVECRVAHLERLSETFHQTKLKLNTLISRAVSVST